MSELSIAGDTLLRQCNRTRTSMKCAFCASQSGGQLVLVQWSQYVFHVTTTCPCASKTLCHYTKVSPSAVQAAAVRQRSPVTQQSVLKSKVVTHIVLFGGAAVWTYIQPCVVRSLRWCRMQAAGLAQAVVRVRVLKGIK
jgi:hypothetical protein